MEMSPCGTNNNRPKIVVLTEYYSADGSELWVSQFKRSKEERAVFLRERQSLSLGNLGHTPTSLFSLHFENLANCTIFPPVFFMFSLDICAMLNFIDLNITTLKANLEYQKWLRYTFSGQTATASQYFLSTIIAYYSMVASIGRSMQALAIHDKQLWGSSPESQHRKSTPESQQQ